MIGRIYYASDQTDSTQGSQTLMYLTAGAAAICLVERAAISFGTQDSSEQVEAKISSYAIATTGGDTVSLTPADPNDVATSSSANVEGTIAVTTGSTGEVLYYRQGFNVLSGFLWTPANDDELILVNPNAKLDLGLSTSITTGGAWSVHYTVRELGT